MLSHDVAKTSEELQQALERASPQGVNGRPEFKPYTYGCSPVRARLAVIRYYEAVSGNA